MTVPVLVRPQLRSAQLMCTLSDIRQDTTYSASNSTT